MALAACPAVAGPPYFTDDPEPTETGHWEIYSFASGTQTAGSLDGAVGLDLNYGPVPNVQLTATIPVNYTHGDVNAAGFGDVEIGVKFRFVHHARSGFSVSAFPRVFLPTGSSRFTSGRVGLLLPVWAQKDWGKWSVFGGGGYTINPGADSRNYWLANLAVTRTVSDRLSLGAEIAHRGPDAVGGAPYTALNFGGIFRLHETYALLASAGPGIDHASEGGRFNAYLALGVRF